MIVQHQRRLVVLSHTHSKGAISTKVEEEGLKGHKHGLLRQVAGKLFHRSKQPEYRDCHN